MMRKMHESPKLQLQELRRIGTLAGLVAGCALPDSDIGTIISGLVQADAGELLQLDYFLSLSDCLRYFWQWVENRMDADGKDRTQPSLITLNLNISTL